MYQNSNSISSRIKQYQDPQKQIPRELHGPCRGEKLVFTGNHSRSNNKYRVCENEGFLDEMGEELFLKFKRVGQIAVESLRYVKKEKVVINVDKEDDVDEVEFVANGCENGKMGSTVEDVVVDLDKEIDVDGVEFVAKGCEDEKMGSRVEDVGRFLGTLSLVKNDDFLVSPVQNQLATFQLDHPMKKPDEKGVSVDLLQEAFVPITSEEKNEVYKALLLYNRRKVLVTHENSNIEITGEVLQCLTLGQWLNDEVINVYMELLKEREKREPKRFFKCHFFNTFFYKKLIGGKSGYDYKSVRRWTTQKNLGYTLSECDKIFVPIHKQAHWCLAVINKKDKKFQYLDSLRGTDANVLRILTMYFVDEVKDKSGVDIDIISWTQEHVKDIPLQKNGWDCGMFMIKYVDFYSSGLGLLFSQEHMPYFRLRTTKEILRLEAG